MKDNPCTARLIAYYGSIEETAKALNCHKETLRLWLRDGIPLGKSLFVEEKTKGSIKAEDIIRDARAAA
jgi:hypothetical protein